MRILHVGNGNEKHMGRRYYDVGRKLQHGLIRNHHNALFFSDRDVARTHGVLGTKWRGAIQANSLLVKVASQFKPELLLIGHADIIRNDTLAEIRHKLPDMRIAQFNVDPLFRPENDAAIRARLPVVDATFITTGGEVLTRYNTQHGIVSYMPNPTDGAIECYQAFAHDNPYDMFYAVRAATMQDAEQNDRVTLPRLLREALPELTTSFHGFDGADELFGVEFHERMAQCAMGLNLSHKHTTKGDRIDASEAEKCYYSSDRISQYMGNGLLTFTERGFQQEALFSEDEIIFFSNAEELVDKVRYYKQHDEERRQIAYNGWHAYHSHFSAELIARYIVEATMGEEVQGYAWDVSLY
jgi:Glycosyl transferases group 1